MVPPVQKVPFRPLCSYLPHAEPTTPHWRPVPHPLDEPSSKAIIPQHCDTLIIGTGLTGVSTAYHLLEEPDSCFDGTSTDHPNILFLEARPGVCSGATARNGGHLKRAFMGFGPYRERFGKDVAAELAAFDEAQIAALEVVEREGIDCEFRKGRSWDVYLDEEEAEIHKAKWIEWQHEGWEALEGLDCYAEQKCGVRNAKLAINAPAAMLWPFKLTVGLLEVCLKKGAQVRTSAPVTGLERIEGTASEWHVKTPRGNVRCKRVVVATNAYTASILPEYEAVIRPCKGINSLMEGPPSHPDYVLGHSSLNLHHGPGLANYIIPQPSGSIINGGAYRAATQGLADRYDTLDDSTLLPDGKGTSPENWGLTNVLPRWIRGCERMDEGSLWTGIMGVTPDNMPHIGKVPGRDGINIAAGFCGRGLLVIFLASKGLARMITQGGDVQDWGVPACFETSARRLEQKWE